MPAFEKYKPISEIAKDVKRSGYSIPLENGLKIEVWDLIQLELDLHIRRYRYRVPMQKKKIKKLSNAAKWEARDLAKHEQSGINIGI
jgi:hypothetical protein